MRRISTMRKWMLIRVRSWAEFYLRDRGYRTVWEEDAALLKTYDRVAVYPVDLDEDLDPALFEGYTEGPDGFWKREK